MDVLMKNDMDIFMKNELYTISLHEFLQIEKDRFFLLYAPLSTLSMIVSHEDIAQLRSFLTHPVQDESLNGIVSALLDRTPSEEALSKRISGIDGFVNMSLLLNNVCNFNCSYCYSAQGRSNAQLDEKKLLAAINFFIDKKRTNVPQLSLTFLGGGEPMLSWKLIEKGVEHAKQRAEKEDFKLLLKIVSNGSILTKNAIKFICDNDIEFVVSFDILEDIQNLQRKKYELVSKNLLHLSDSGVLLSVNAVITPHNVHRQVEMVEKMKQSFPKIDYLSFEPLMNLNEWSAELIDNDFYNDFIAQFMQAHQLAESYNINLSCSVLRNVDCVVERYCAGEFAICADGSITICPCVSSPEMNNYKEYIYGKINTDGKVEINNEKLTSLLKEDVHSYTRCKHCFAKWNCGGGCISTNRMETAKQKQWKCDFIRNFTKFILWNRTKEQYEMDYQKNIMEILTEQSKQDQA